MKLILHVLLLTTTVALRTGDTLAKTGAVVLWGAAGNCKTS